MTIPAMPPPPIPDFFPSSIVPLLASWPVVLTPPDLWCWLLLGTGGVPGGGGGAGTELHALPPDLSCKFVRFLCLREIYDEN